MNICKTLILIGFIIGFQSCKEANFSNERLVPDSDNEATNKSFNYLPSNTTGAVYERATYTLSYAEEYEQAEWVAYVLKASDIKDTDYKRPYFEVDPTIITGAAHWRNYKNSGYNKGHLCPAGDRRASYDDYVDTFFTSNISPQDYDFNAGIWNRLEQKVRYWAKKQDSLYVVTGGVLSHDLETIGYEHVAVPKYFYKVLLSSDRKQMIGFLLPNEKSEQPLYNFITAVDEIEKLTGIDFFPALDDALENELEAKTDYSGWRF